jgi:hypothetical protein
LRVLIEEDWMDNDVSRSGGKRNLKMLENQKGRNHLIDLDVDGRIILIWVLNK